MSEQELATMLYRAWRKHLSIDEMLKALKDTDWTTYLQSAHDDSELLKTQRSGDYEKFMTHVVEINECLVWTGQGVSRNRPLFRPKSGFETLASIWLYRYYHPDLPDDVKLKKLCDTPNCIASEHHQIKGDAINDMGR